MEKVTATEFVTTWQKSNTLDEVVSSLSDKGLTRAAIQSRATSYRKNGVSLKQFPRGRRTINVAALNTIISELDRQTVSE